MAINDLIRVRNIGDRPIRTKWEVGKYVDVQPGEEILMPWAAFVASFGNHDLRDGEVDKPRTAEVVRIRAYYGAYDDDALWEEVRPRVKAETIDGVPIRPLVDDPEGESVTVAATTMEEANLLAKQVAALESQLRELRTAQAQATQGQPVDLPEDTPRKVGVRRS